jgi:putative DNA primase/helicase
MWFACNEIPPTESDDSPAFYERWIIIDFPNTFRDNADPNLLKKLSTNEELSGLLNLALRSLTRLLARDQFEDHIDIDRKEKQYIMGSNTVKAFVIYECEMDFKAKIVKKKFYQQYVSFCQNLGRDPVANNTFTRELKRWVPNLDDARVRKDGKSVYVYKGIKMKDSS